MKMNQEKVKLIIKNMELLIHSLKQEIEEPVEYEYEEIVPHLNDDEVDEYYDDREDV